MLPQLLLWLLGLSAGAAAQGAVATKCRDGARILYQFGPCPPGHVEITTAPGGTLSVLGKSPAQRAQEEAFLAERERQQRQEQAWLAQQSRSLELAEQRRHEACQRLARRLRDHDAAAQRTRNAERREALQRGRRALQEAQRRQDCRP
ncbi:hypothetical protein BKK79_33150 [Cupriavidus sp. USMAA2-4]|uniref:DUF4124 domain-containing protein n=1 Tax=Cupriavidus malaysiensis TaxID=367825 RepID=A0A1D9IBE8_9BURK|nr:hypothetical protein BKK79_33150 [Cupriavidus sp. USMAA2-4]AOZ09454.1 hypothetical protein BKK80_27235 [Cupriavidus malaysiensis]